MTASNSTAALAGTPLPIPTVFVVDDDAGTRRFIESLARSVGLSVEAYSSGCDFLDRRDLGRPGCLILDLRISDMSGLEIQRRLNAAGDRLPVIFATAYGEVPLAAEAMRAGAVDFLQKPVSPHVLLERIHEAIGRDRDRRHRLDLAHDVRRRIARLTVREREIMEYLATGQSTKAIALRLGISIKTVDNHRARLLDKLNVDNTTQLARMLARLDDRPEQKGLAGPHLRSPRA